MTTEAKEKDENINVVEEKDGSVTVDLPGHMADNSEDGDDEPAED